MRSVSLFFAVCGLLLASAGLARAQAIVLKDGSKVFSNEFSLEGEKIIRTIKIGEATAKSEIMRQNIDSLEWPYPAELTESQDLLAKGKTEEAIAVLQKGKEFFEKFNAALTERHAPVVEAAAEAAVEGDGGEPGEKKGWFKKLIGKA